ncbi:unnamed protein product [Dicrocoelium dendriticum]|nr:unnamed protein product [Dicrocoelium dendriticum]
MVASVPFAIIGIDFLRQFGLLADAGRHRLLDERTKLGVDGFLSDVPILSPVFRIAGATSDYLSLRSGYPRRVRPAAEHPPVMRDVAHHIVTRSQPVSAQPRRLAPDRLRAARADLDHMLQLGIVRPSSSPWAAPFHMVPKFYSFGFTLDMGCVFGAVGGAAQAIHGPSVGAGVLRLDTVTAKSETECCKPCFPDATLTELFRGKLKKLEFPDAARAAFKSLKEAIAKIGSILHRDPAAPLPLSADASDVAVGAVLQQ